MRTWTLQEFKDKIELEHDLQEESFISDEEMINYINEGIDWAESQVIGLYEDYYLTKTSWAALVDSTTLPTNIYANKVRRVEVAQSNTAPYNSKQLFKNSNLEENFIGYNIFHNEDATPVIEFENIPDFYNYYRLIYTRNAKRVVESTDVIDLPEVAVYYAQQFVKIRCYQKEIDPKSFRSSEEILQMSQALVDTLSNITNDGSDQLQADLSFYREFDDVEFY
jgi:hypothetical protein